MVGRPNCMRSGEQQQLARMVIERVGVHGPDQADSSAHVRRYAAGNPRKLMPLWPYGLNSRGLASTAAVGLMNASLRSLVIDGGSGLPCHFCSSGLGSNRSIWLGPPSMNRKITFFALAGKCGFRGASGFGASRSSPQPPEQVRQRHHADAAAGIAKKRAPGGDAS